MSNTDNLKLPYLAAGQAQKHVTLNESLRMLDALVHLSLKSRTLVTPPSTPENGARYLIPASATGAWAGKSGMVAAWQDGAWAYFAPQIGWRAWIEAEATTRLYTGTSWVIDGGNSASSFETLGINATASVTNRLTVKSPVSLFDQEGGSHRITINKAAVANTASTLFQTNYSGRAEFGLTGSDDFQLKTSPDGTIWANVLTFDKTTGLGTVKANPAAPLGIATKQYVDAQIAAQSGGGAGLPAGAIAHFAMNTPPAGWLKANGAAVSRSLYATLFAAIGTLYGAGDGSTTFNLPDLRAEFVRGWDDARGVDAGRGFGTVQSDAVGPIQVRRSGYSGASNATGMANGASGLVSFTADLGDNYATSSGLQPSISIVRGVSNAAETRPRSIALLACIKT